MKSCTFFFLSFLHSFLVIGQMSYQDSSAQVITYWDLGDAYQYSIQFDKAKFVDSDTLSSETLTYDVDITVIDSTHEHYIVQWVFKNHQSDSKNEVLQKLTALPDSTSFHVKISAVGEVISIENWEEVKQSITKKISQFRTDFKDNLEASSILDKIESKYASKAAIETMAIQDIHQFHNFHGGKYFLNEKAEGVVLTPNVYYSDKPFDTKISVELEHLDFENSQYRIRSVQEIDSDQLTETTYTYLSTLFENTGQVLPQRVNFKALTHLTETVSRIHDSGWILESVLWKEVISEGIVNMETRSILMK